MAQLNNNNWGASQAPVPVAAAAQAAEAEARDRALVLYKPVPVCDRRFHAACVILPLAKFSIHRVHKAETYMYDIPYLVWPE